MTEVYNKVSIMPVCKAEAHRALELLEDYYSRLDDSEEKELSPSLGDEVV